MSNDALDFLDRVAGEMEIKWGVDRLRQLVPSEMGKRFGAQQEIVDQAIQSGDQQWVTSACEAMVRAWKALDATAEATGAVPMFRMVWVTTNAAGQRVAVCRDDGGYKAARDAGADLVYTLPEIVRILDGMPELVRVAKERLGGVVTSVTDREPIDWDNGDEVPF
jgi:hypothetical protein